MFVKREVGKPSRQVAHGHLHQLADGLVGDAHVGRLGLQARAVAGGAHRLAAVASQQHAVLNGVGLTLYPLKETVNAREFGASVPQQVALLIRKLIIRSMNGKIIF